MPRQHLTPNACLVCRKKRTKCDGQLPCRRCRARGEECAYEDKKWRTKDHLRSEIERLRTEQRQGNALIRALTNNDPKQWGIVLDRMRAGDPPDTIAEWILVHSSRCLSGASSRSPRPLKDSADLPQNTLPPPPPALSPGVNPVSPAGFRTDKPGSPRTPTLKTEETSGVGRGSKLSLSTSSLDVPHQTSFSAHVLPERHPSFQDSLASPAVTISPPPPPPLDAPGHLHLPPPEPPGEPVVHTWTKVTSDAALVQRLLARFFSGSLPSLSLVSQPHFLRDFRDGTPRYCSEALVNAILGMACRATTMASQLISKVSFGDAFIGEAKGLLAREQDHVDLPSIQALGVISLAEMSQGNEAEASDLAREFVRASIRFLMRTQPLDHDHDDDFRTVRALVYCGGFSLIRVLRLLTGDLEPKTGPLFMRLYPDTRDVGDDAPEARVERGISLQMQFFSELQYCPPLSRFVFEVTEATHTFSSYHYSKAMTASDLDGALKKCMVYYRQVGESAAFAMDSGPDVLLTQIWYHFCLLSLLQPFVKSSASLVDGLPRSLSGDATPRTVCRQASEAIISLTNAYQTRYCLTYLPPLLPYMVFAAALHQLSLVTDQPSLAHQHYHGRADSPRSLSPRAVLDSTSPNTGTRPTLSIPGPAPHATRGSVTVWMPEQASPSFTPYTQRGTSARSTAATKPLDEGHARRPSVCSFLSSAASDRDEPSLPDTGPDTLPIFTSQPVDLVTIGSLQLTSMGAQHPGAAEAAHLLRSVGAAPDLLAPGLGPASAGLHTNPTPASPVNRGVQAISAHDVVIEPMPHDGPSSAPVYRFGRRSLT